MTSDAEGSFKSLANYLRALATLAGHTTIPMATRTKAMAGQRAAVLASTSLHDKPHGGSDLAGVRRSLANAWGTELLLGLSREYAVEDDLVRLADNWAAVQAHFPIRALAECRGIPNAAPCPPPRHPDRLPALHIS
jgi:hypothetical protein